MALAERRLFLRRIISGRWSYQQEASSLDRLFSEFPYIRPVFDPDDYTFEFENQLQVAATRTLPITPIKGFEGLGGGFQQPNAFNFDKRTPDPAGAPGFDQYVQIVNFSLAVFDKTGAVIQTPVDVSTIWQGFEGACQDYASGDAIVLYDRTANRWFITQAAGTRSPYSQCIAISTTADATGTYARYEYQFRNKNDYGKFGIGSDGYYGTFLMIDPYAPDSPALGSIVCAYDRQEMLIGSKNAGSQCVELTKVGALLPSDIEGTTNPPPGTPEFIVGFRKRHIQLRKYRIDWSNSANSKLTSPFDIPVPSFKKPKSSFMVAEPSPGPDLDPIADRPMFRCTYRKVGTRESLMFNQTVQVFWSGRPFAGIRWYVVIDPSGTPVVEQGATFSPSEAFRWMGSMAMDKVGNIAIAYSLANDSIAPSLYLTGRSPSDQTSTLAAEVRIIPGQGSASVTRWGDYSMMMLDPSDDCTFWFTGEYVDPSATNALWHTYIAHMKFNDCN
jgi:hypothetical protein